MGTKLDQVMTDNDELPLVKPHDLLITRSHEVTRQIKCYISTCNGSLTTKHDKVTYHEGLVIIKLHNPLSICSCKVT